MKNKTIEYMEVVKKAADKYLIPLMDLDVNRKPILDFYFGCGLSVTKPQDKIEFKSLPQYWEKEKSGVKNNTVRKWPIGDLRDEVLERWCNTGNYGKIILRNTATDETFERQVTDITFWQGIIIISWSPCSK